MKELWKKLDLKNKKMIFVQYASNNKCYYLWDPQTYKIIIVSNVDLDEGI
jgi:hypothetical protein